MRSGPAVLTVASLIAATLAGCGDAPEQLPKPHAATLSVSASPTTPAATPTPTRRSWIRFGQSRRMQEPLRLPGVYGAVNLWFFAERDEHIIVRALRNGDLVGEATSEGIYDWRALLLDPDEPLDEIRVSFFKERDHPDGGFDTTGIDDITLWPVGMKPYRPGRVPPLVDDVLERRIRSNERRLRYCQRVWGSKPPIHQAYPDSRCAELMGGFRTTRFGTVARY